MLFLIEVSIVPSAGQSEIGECGRLDSRQK